MRTIKVKDLLWIFTIFIFIRILWTSLAFFTLSQNVPSTPGYLDRSVYFPEQYTFQDRGFITEVLINSWYRWDTGYFLKIADQGFSSNDGSTAFAPLYPLLICLISRFVNGNYLISGIILSNFFCVITYILFYITALYEFNGDTTVSRRALLFLISFPTAFFLFAPYSESLFLTLILSSWLLARSNRWFLAGISGSLAVLTRFQGIFVVLLLGILLLINKKPLLRSINPFGYSKELGFINFLKSMWKCGVKNYRKIIVISLPIITFIVYMIWLQYNRGMDLLSTQTRFGNQIVAPWKLPGLIIGRLQYGNLIPHDVLNFFTLVLLIILVVYGWKIINPAFSWFSLLTLSFVVWYSLWVLSFQSQNGKIFTSLIRYAITIFPVFMTMGKIVNRKIILIGIVFISFSIQIFLGWLYLNWYWVA